MENDSRDNHKALLIGKNTLWISSKKEDNIGVDIVDLMELITPFTILNQNFHEIDLI